MIGKRNDVSPHLLEEGDYGIWEEDGNWYGYCPGPGELIANLASHQVIEHEDGTITVAPSIECSGGAAKGYWHGYLEHGVWRKV